MDFEKFTRKSQEAINSAHEIAVSLNHQELVPLHLVLALVRQADGLIPSVLSKMGIETSAAESAALDILKSFPRSPGRASRPIPPEASRRCSLRRSGGHHR